VSSSDIGCAFYSAVEKHPSAALRLSFVIATYKKYASFLMIARALHLHIFEQLLFIEAFAFRVLKPVAAQPSEVFECG
jgi:hypothetical protein